MFTENTKCEVCKNSNSCVYGKGKMKLSSTSKKTKTINDVLYVLSFMTLQKITIYFIEKLN